MFTSARIKLTLSYLAILMAVSVMFSVFIYRVVASELNRLEHDQRLRIERRLHDRLMFPFAPESYTPMMITDPELIGDARNRILFRLLVLNGGILAISGMLGYWLAGRTLKPIADMIEEQHRFISDASHELKTPLTSLKTAMEVYLRDKKRTLKGAQSLVTESIRDVDRLSQLSESMLKLTYSGMQSPPIPAGDVDLGSAVAEAVKRTAPMAAKKHIRINLKTGAITVCGVADQLTDLFVILLDNAVKYSREKSTVTVAMNEKDGSALVAVSDCGIGISGRDQKRIFDRFFRADNARTSGESGGYGLGLSIAKKIVKEHKGSIMVTSKLGQGSTFSVRLPVVSSST